MARGTTPRRTRERKKKRVRQIEYVKTLRRDRVRISAMLIRDIELTKKHRTVRNFMDKVFGPVMTKLGILFVNASIPLAYTYCQSQKIKMRTANVFNIVGKRVYQVFRESRGRREQRVTPNGQKVMSRKGNRTIGSFLHWIVDTVKALFKRERKPQTDDVQTMTKLTDRMKSWLQKSKYGKPLYMMIMSVAEVARTIAAMRGWLEDWKIVIHIDCSPYIYEPGYVKLSFKPYPYIIAKLRDKYAHEFVKQCPRDDKWCKEYRAMWAKDILSACDARVGTAMGQCFDMAMKLLEQDWQSTRYYTTYAKVTSQSTA